MSHVLTVLIVASFLAPLLPPATCQGTAACCCAPGAATAMAVAREGAPAAEDGAAARPTAGSGLERRCPCAPEMRGCPTDREPGTPPVSPPPTALQATPSPPVPGTAFGHHSPPAARMPSPSAEPPPLPPPADLLGILRI